MRLPVPDPGGSAVSAAGESLTSVAGGELTVTFSDVAGRPPRGADGVLFSRAISPPAFGLLDAGEITPVPPSTAIEVTASEDASIAIRP
jgi:hypothetical protein